MTSMNIFTGNWKATFFMELRSAITRALIQTV